MSSKVEPRLLVIVWQGQEVPDALAKNIVENMVANGICPIPELVTMKMFDSSEIAKIVGARTVELEHVIPHDDDCDPIVQSIVFIGKRYESCEQNPSVFALRLSADLSEEAYKTATGKPSDLALVTAVEILATKTVNVRKYAKHMNECGVTKAMLSVIHDAYYYHNKHVS